MKKGTLAAITTLICGFIGGVWAPFIGIVIAISVMGGFIINEIEKNKEE